MSDWTVENDNPRCGICAGRADFMGVLANRDCFCCRLCGWKFSEMNDSQARLEFPEAFEEETNQ